MRRILDHSTREQRHTDADGNEQTREVVHHVNYVDDAGALHGLTFHPAGTNVAGEAETEPRLVGEHVPEYVFSDPEEAVEAYERGKIV